MSSETLTPDGNMRNVAGAVTDDSNHYIKRLRIDDSTKGLKVTLVGGTGTGTLKDVTDGTTTVSDATTLTFTSGATVTDGGSGNAEVAISASSGLTVGTTTVASGTDKYILYDNSGTLGVYSVSGTGTEVALTNSPVFVTQITTPSVITADSNTQPTLSITAGNAVSGDNDGGDIDITAGTESGSGRPGNVNLKSTGGYISVTSDGTNYAHLNTGSLTTTKTFTFPDTAGTFALNSQIASAGLTIGSSVITSGTDTKVLYDNSGVVGEYTVSGTGDVAMTDSPTFTTQITGSYLTASELLSTDASKNIVSLTTGSGVLTALGVNTGSTGAFVVLDGALGTPSSGTGTNITGITAAHVVAGTFGTGAYTMDTKLTVPQVINTANDVTVSSNAGTVPVTYKINNFTNDSAGTMAITLAVTGAVDGQTCIVRIYDYSAAAQTIGWTNTEDSTVSAPTTSSGSTTLPLTVGFQFNGQTSLWRCIASA